jgi:hypothetical protein
MEAAVGGFDWRLLAQLLVYAFGAGAIVQQLRNLNGTVQRLEKVLAGVISDVNDLRERTSSLEAFQRFTQGDGR